MLAADRPHDLGVAWSAVEARRRAVREAVERLEPGLRERLGEIVARP